MHLIARPTVALKELGIPVATIILALDEILPRARFFGDVSYGQDREVDELCWGFSNDCFLKVDKTGDLVEYIWFDAIGAAPQLAGLRKAIETINDVALVIVADYWVDAVGVVDDREFMDRYFRHLAYVATLSPDEPSG